jgi:hypothetical protein
LNRSRGIKKPSNESPSAAAGVTFPSSIFTGRQYQNTKGEWQTIYHGIFTDWKGIRRKMTLGNDLPAAKDGLAIRLADNVNRVDFDAQRQKASEQGMTIAAWSKSYVQLEEVKKQRALNRTRDFIAAINRHMGDMLLTDVKREHLFRYRNERVQEHIIRAGKPPPGLFRWVP